MADKFLGVLDPDDPIRQEVWYDEFTDKITIRDMQDCDPILEMNRIERNEEHGKKFGGFKKIACIPNIVVNHLIKEGIFWDQKALQKWLNKSEFKNLRTKEGQI